VEMREGKIWINSELGKGSTFTFTFKAKLGVEKDKRLLNHGENLKNVRIMAIDDDPDILRFFHEAAQSLGIYCDTALSGEEALRLVKRGNQYQIYFVDWKMPDIDGVQLTSEIKSRVNANSVVVLISAEEWSEVAAYAKQAGVDKFLSKPLFPSTIAKIISESMNTGKMKAGKAKTEATGLFAGRRILLAEDIEINREIVLALLTPTSLEIDCAENGVEAVNMFREAPGKYDMIFMDVQMPKMDGYEATRRIRAFDSLDGKTIPIVAMTANAFKEDIEKCLESGMNDHIKKPLDMDTVFNKLRFYLTRTHNGALNTRDLYLQRDEDQAIPIAS